VLLPRAHKSRAVMRRYFQSVERTRIVWDNFPPALAFVCDTPLHPQ
jgi:hypothetical protein